MSAPILVDATLPACIRHGAAGGWNSIASLSRLTPNIGIYGMRSDYLICTPTLPIRLPARLSLDDIAALIGYGMISSYTDHTGKVTYEATDDARYFIEAWIK